MSSMSFQEANRRHIDKNPLTTRRRNQSANSLPAAPRLQGWIFSTYLFSWRASFKTLWEAGTCLLLVKRYAPCHFTNIYKRLRIHSGGNLSFQLNDDLDLPTCHSERLVVVPWPLGNKWHFGQFVVIRVYFMTKDDLIFFMRGNTFEIFGLFDNLK